MIYTQIETLCSSYPNNFMIETCDHGKICNVTVWSSLELSRIDKYKQAEQLTRTTKDDSGVCLFSCSARCRISIFRYQKKFPLDIAWVQPYCMGSTNKTFCLAKCFLQKHNSVSQICFGCAPGCCDNFKVAESVEFQKVDSILHFCSAFLGKHVMKVLPGQQMAGTIGIAGLSNG